MGKRLGFIVGINNYQDSTFYPLQCAENDARALAQWLVNTQGGQWSPNHVQHIYGSHATLELVESQLTQICLSQAEADDLVFIYFACHAYLDESSSSGDGYLAFSNTSLSDLETGLHLASLVQNVFAQSRASQIVLMLDCVQSGSLWPTRRGTSFDFRPLLASTLHNLQKQPNRLVLTSCRGHQQASEQSDHQLGLFMRRMLIGVCGPALDPTTKTLQLGSLQSYLTRTLNEQQRPQSFGQELSPIVLVGNLSLPESSPASALSVAPAAPSATPLVPPSPTIPHTESLTIPSKRTGGGLLSNSGLLSNGGLLSNAHMNSSMQTPPISGQTLQPPIAESHYPDHDTSTQISQSTVDQHLQQQSQLALSQAQQLLQAQNYQEAYTLVERVLQAFPTQTSAWLLQAQILGTAGRSQDALAAIAQLLQIDPNHALAWSMQAFLLSNIGQYPAALTAIDRSLELDPHNTESYSIKQNIMQSLASAQVSNLNQQQNYETFRSSQTSLPQATDKGRGMAFVLTLMFQLVALGMCSVGTAIALFAPTLPSITSIAIIACGLTLACASASRVTYRYGWLHLLPTLLISGAASIGAVLLEIPFFLSSPTTPLTHPVLQAIANHPIWLGPVIFSGIWLLAMALFPPLLAFGSAIAGTGYRRSAS